MKKVTYFVWIILVALLLNSCSSILGLVPEEKINMLTAEDLPVAIISYSTGSPNSVGGIDVYIRWANISPKTIKYIVFSVKPYNAVNDVVSSEIGGKVIARLQATGPIDPSQYASTGMWGPVWYNNTIEYMEIVEIEITFMDNTVITYTGHQISEMIIE